MPTLPILASMKIHTQKTSDKLWEHGNYRMFVDTDALYWAYLASFTEPNTGTKVQTSACIKQFLSF